MLLPSELSLVLENLELKQEDLPWDYLHQLAQHFCLPVEFYQKKTQKNWCFVWKKAAIQLKMDEKQFVCWDWVGQWKKLQNISQKNLQTYPLIKAFLNFPRHEKIQSVWDCTLGSGADSLLLLILGMRQNFSLTSFERNLATQVLAYDAKRRLDMAYNLPWKIEYQNSPLHQSSNVDVIYYDPMFPQKDPTTNKLYRKTKSAKEMEMAQILIGDDKDKLEFLDLALKLVKVGVLCKRSSKIPSYLPSRVVWTLKGNSCDFDFYR